MKTFLKHGPGLRKDYNVWVVARDPEAKRVLLGGLGGMGVGQMWFGEDDRHKEYPGYAEARIEHAPADGVF